MRSAATGDRTEDPPAPEPGDTGGNRRQADNSRGGSPLERVTVNLTARSVSSLDRLVELTGDTKTDSINKSLQFYSYIQQLLGNGGALYVREANSEEMERLRIL